MPTKLLLIEDDPGDFDVTRDLLLGIRAGDFAIDWVQEFDGGLDELCRGRHDVCLADDSLGERTGLDLLEGARTQGCQTPVVLMLPQLGEPAEERLLAAGATDYLLKPSLDTDRLWRALRHAMERAATLVELRKRDSLVRAVFEAAQDAMLIADDEGRYVDANPAALSLLGWSPEDLGARGLHDVIPAGDEALVAATWATFLREGQQSGEFDLVDAHGRKRILEFRARANILPGRHLSVLRDVTEVRRIRAQMSMHDRMASVGTLAAGVVHEINNPLAALLSNLGVVRRGLEAVDPGALPALEDVLPALDDAGLAAERVRDIVRDMRMFARADDDPKPVDVRRVVDSSLRLAAHQLKFRARVVRADGDVPPVLGSEGRLSQVFLNLIVNAAQAMPEATARENELRVRCFTEGGQVHVELEDTGCGIPPEHLPRLFEPFFTTKPAGVGTGLGLPICHGIVTALGGEIRVRSELGRGSTFTVVLPAAEIGG